MAKLKKKSLSESEYQLIALGDDLVASIVMAAKEALPKQTLHMQSAIYAYSDFRKELLENKRHG